MLKEKIFFTKLIPLSALLVCVAVISRFFIEPFKFPVNFDDCLYSALLQNHSIWELMHLDPAKYEGDYMIFIAGRMSNFYSLFVFSVLKTHHSIYYLYDFLIFLLLIISLYSLFTSLSKNKMMSQIDISKRVLLSCFVSCTLFAFLLDGRYEVFYWISSISNHLLSIILFVFTLTLFFGKHSLFRIFVMSVFSFWFGQMNEVYALSYFLVFLFISLARPKSRGTFILLFLIVSISLFINWRGHGTSDRFEVQYAIPTHFHFIYSLQDAIETICLPLINYRYLLIKVACVLLLFFLVRNYLKIQVSISDKYFHLFNRLLLLIVLLSIFLYCYVFGEICTYRYLLFYNLSLIYFVFIMASKNILNPVKLFFK